jgi:hypothetical protein
MNVERASREVIGRFANQRKKHKKRQESPLLAGGRFGVSGRNVYGCIIFWVSVGERIIGREVRN